MATAALTGRAGQLRFSTNLAALTTALTKVAELMDCTLTVNRKEIDVTSHDSSGYKSVLYGIMDAKLTAKVNYISTGAAQKNLAIQLLASAPLKMRASVLASTQTSKKKWEFNCIITKFEQSLPTDKQIVGTVEAIVDGAITRTS